MGGSKPSTPKVIQPKTVQPTPVAESVAEVKVGNVEDQARKRKRIGRSQLRSNVGAATAPASGVGV